MKKSLTALAVAGAAAASLIAVAPTASASGCVNSTITTGYQGPGTVAYKAAAGCLDLNLTYAHNNHGWGHDRYEGFYKDANGFWHNGTAGYQYVDDGYYNAGDIVLVSNLTSGRAFSVGSELFGGNTVVITH
ncbi:hypothetical protein [Streptomyces lutosisoli]|uniref:Streptomyces killer toxin-like beta/gamma crystallin domain-containing protein n=1 Tax=Streptomyces lutosisoli TaxID=2665721 RepID=A0ABW2VB81_9ACTN